MRNSNKGRAAQIEARLDHPDRTERLRALRELKHLADTGALPTDDPRPWVNVHCHSFHSYNAHGFSPSRIAWEMYRRGLNVAGIVDFDVLDGVDEALAASDALLFKFTAGMETRIYVKEFEGVVVNSPNEPAIAYYMGQGFVRGPAPGSDAARTLRRLGECAAARNLAILNKVDEYLEDVTLDYDQDVLPLTASGNATERHMCEAYDTKACDVFPDRKRRARFWAAKLRMAEQDIRRIMDDPVRFRDTMRYRLMKYGSPGYVSPEPKNFPTHEETVSMIRACGAMPMYAWMDGTMPGEEDVELLLDFFCSAGQVGINIIPDRNWNYRDPAEKSLKVAKLNEVIARARSRHFPISIGTEMNRASQPLVDHLDAPELKPHVDVFLEGGQIIWGHSLLLRHGGFGYVSPQADAAFGKDVVRKNKFFRDVGARPVPHGSTLQALRAASKAGDPRRVLRALSA